MTKAANKPTHRTYRVSFQEVTCYALLVTASSEYEAIGIAASRFDDLNREQRDAAVTCAASLDWFEAEEARP
jgi:hypothetical protein